MRGLSIVRGPDADGRWYWRYRSADESGEVKTLWAGWATASEAKTAAIATVAGVEAAAEEESKPRTVRELFRIWLRTLPERVNDDRHSQLPDQLRSSTVEIYTRIARRFCPTEGPRKGSPTDLGDILLDQLREEHLRRYRDNVGVAPKTARTDLVCLGVAWRWAQDRGLVTRSMPRVATSSRTVRPKPTPSPGDVAELLDRMEGWARLGLLLLASTGARRGELAELTPDRVRWEPRASILLWEKGVKGRWVPLPPDVALELRAWLDDRAAGRRVDLDPTTVLGVKPGTIRRRLRDHMVAAAGEGQAFSPHAIRRMVSTRLLGAGVDAATYEAVMGHGFALGLAAYASPDEEAKAAAIEALALPKGEVIPFRKRHG
jgi:integrase